MEKQLELEKALGKVKLQSVEDCFVEIQLSVPENDDCNYYDDFANYIQQHEVEVPCCSSNNTDSSNSNGTIPTSPPSSSSSRRIHEAIDRVIQSATSKQYQYGKNIEETSKRNVRGKNKVRKLARSSTPTPAVITPSPRSDLKRRKDKDSFDLVTDTKGDETEDSQPSGEKKKRSRSTGNRAKKVPNQQPPNDTELAVFSDFNQDEQGGGTIIQQLSEDQDEEKFSKFNWTTPEGVEEDGLCPLFIDEPTNEKPGPDYYELATSFRSLLKLPKAYRWVYCEFFYSDLDRIFFAKKNDDLEECIKDNFPKLKTRQLTRYEWMVIRKYLGKPRRLSASFLASERKELEFTRSQIRRIHRRQVTPSTINNLPDEIPLHLIVGTRVSAMVRNRGGYGMLYRGTVDGLNLANNEYRITFDSESVGTESVIDDEVLSDEPPPSVSLTSYSMKIKRPDPSEILLQRRMANMSNPNNVGSSLPENGFLGGFRVQFLEMILRFRKLVQYKWKAIQQLKELNAEAEKLRTSGRRYSKDFMVKYAVCIASLDLYNAEIPKCYEAIDLECCLLCTNKEIGFKVVNSQQVLNFGDMEAQLLVSTLNGKHDESMMVRNERVRNLITSITSLLCQLRDLSGNPDVWHPCDVHSLKASLNKIKITLDGRNVDRFENLIEIPVNRITAGIIHDSKFQRKRD